MRNLQEHLAFIQLQGGNNTLLELLMSFTVKLLKRKFPSVWLRNSYYFNAHHPLASDIDLTYVGTLFEARKIHEYTKANKLLGELNFYPSSLFQSLVKLCNPFELKRDPQLFQKFPSREFTEVQKQVYLTRHILGDIYWLQRKPMIRQKKWNYILSIAGLKLTELDLIHLKDLLYSSAPLDFYLSCRQDDLFNEFKGSPYRSYFPHKYIWEVQDKDYLSNLTEFEKEFLIEQVKWEFWGIGTQLHWIDLKISYEFLERLKKVVIHIGATNEVTQEMDNVLKFIQEQLQATHKNF